MLRENAAACLLTDHLQFIEDERLLCLVDWTIGGTARGVSQLAPGTLMMLRDLHYRYPESGALARRGEDSVLLHALYNSVKVAHLQDAGYLYLYRYHGRNTYPREHHYGLSQYRRASNAHINRLAARIREAATHYPIPRPCLVVGHEGPCFALGG